MDGWIFFFKDDMFWVTPALGAFEESKLDYPRLEKYILISRALKPTHLQNLVCAQNLVSQLVKLQTRLAIAEIARLPITVLGWSLF